MKLSTRIAAPLALLMAAPAAALSISFTKIADQGGVPAVDAGVVAFSSEDFSGGSYLAGIYTGSGGALTTVVDTNTLIPDTSQPFGLPAFWGAPTISQGNVAFMVNESSGASVFASLDGALTRIATDDGTGNLSIDYMRSPMIDGRNVAFRAWNGSGYAVLTSVDGVLETSASDTGSLFASDATSVAFQGGIGTGVYVSSAGVARIVADTTTTIPGQSILFAGFESGVAFDDGNVAFLGAGTLSSDPLVQIYGIYAEIGGMLIRIADTQTLIPGRAETFAGFTAQHQELSIHGETVAFYAGASSGPSGIYVYRDGQLHKVAEVGDLLDGRTVSGFGFGPRGLSGDALAFNASFEDGTYGVFLATIPEPGTGLLLATGLLALCAGHRAPRRRY